MWRHTAVAQLHSASTRLTVRGEAKKRLKLAVLVGLTTGLVAGVFSGTGGGAPAQAAPNNGPIVLLVNSTDFGGTDGNPGDGICDAGGTVTINGDSLPRCTLRAAIEEANAWAAANGATTGTEVTITLDPDFAGGTIIGSNPTGGTGGFMQTASPSAQANGPVWFVITAPMTINLQGKLGTSGVNDFNSTIFAVLSPAKNVTIKNASGILGGDTAFVIGAAVDNVTIDGGQTYQTASNLMKRFILVNNGAANITFKNYKVGSLSPAATGNTDFNGALVFAPNGQSTLTTKGVLVDNVDFTSPQSPGGTCSSSDGRGCVNAAVTVGAGANLNGFEMRSSTVNNLKPQSATILARIFNAYYVGTSNPAGTLSNLNIHDNTFKNNYVDPSKTDSMYALVSLPKSARLGGRNLIVNNRFNNSDVATQGIGVGWLGALVGSQGPNLTTASNLSISDNYFDGFHGAGISLLTAGLVTMERNTFGIHNSSQPNNSLQENYYPTDVLISNMLSSAGKTNNGIASYFAVSVKVSDSCVASFSVGPQNANVPDYATQPATPLRVDVFWTAERTAELYLGSANISPPNVSVSVPLPPELITGGLSSGYLRMQTQTMGPLGIYAQFASSQYSQPTTIGGTACTPYVIKADKIEPDYGDAKGGNTLTVKGQGFKVQTPTVDFRAGAQSVPCTNVSVNLDGTELTCTVPPSPLPGNREGPVDVIVKSGIRVVGEFINGYHYGGKMPAFLTAVSPTSGSIEGGPGCSVLGSGFVTPVTGVHFDGASWIDTGIQQGPDIELSVDFSLDASNGSGATILGAGIPLGGSALGVSVDEHDFLVGFGPKNAQLGSVDTGRHVAAFQSTVWSYNTVAKTTLPGGQMGQQNIFVGASNTGDIVSTSGNAFKGVIYNVRLWSGGALVRELQPVAWTVAGASVYGLQDTVTGALFTNQGTGTLTAIDAGVPPIEIDHGGEVDQNTITVVSNTQVTYACPSHEVGLVSVSAKVNDIPTNTLVNAYMYWVDGTLTTVKRGWLNAEDLDYEAIMAEPDHGGAIEVLSGDRLSAGTKVWWTYTVTYTHRNPMTGEPSHTGEPGLVDVKVIDSATSGRQVCVIDELLVNTPVGCMAPEEVSIP